MQVTSTSALVTGLGLYALSYPITHAGDKSKCVWKMILSARYQQFSRHSIDRISAVL